MYVPTHSATYSPEDNKLRLYPACRLDADEYARVKAAGFRWAPKQELFVAPMWTPEREDLLLDMCGDIGDEDTSLVDRAEAKADRLSNLSRKRLADAKAAETAVKAIADGIPFGQPILVGHHSEKHARKDAQRIEAGMRKAVRMWDLSQYSKDRARGALRHAKYLERPDVRHRRIKKLKAEIRKHERDRKRAVDFLDMWRKPGLTHERAQGIANFDHIYACFKLADYPREAPLSQYEGAMSLWSALERDDSGRSIITPAQAAEIAERVHTRSIANHDRWLAHLGNRLAYEEAMLDEQGGSLADKWEYAPGGQILTGAGWNGDQWLTILRVNKSGGVVNSLSTNNPHWPRIVQVEDVKDYRPPTDATAAAVRKAKKLPPLVNYPGDGFQHMTKAEWKRKPGGCKGTVVSDDGSYRYRKAFVPGGGFRYAPVFLTDAKVVYPPKPPEVEPAVELPRSQATPAPRPKRNGKPEQSAFDFMRESLRQGVKTVAVPQLFETPADLADRMAEELSAGHMDRILEPSAGTGRLVQALLRRESCAKVVAVEVNLALAEQLRRYEGRTNVTVRCADFLACGDELGKFERIIMNPPFHNGDDVKHIQHALGMLKPGGRLVALCANGPRQRAALKGLAEDSGGWWEDLPAGTFAENGANVNTALIVIEKPESED